MCQNCWLAEACKFPLLSPLSQKFALYPSFLDLKLQQSMTERLLLNVFGCHAYAAIRQATLPKQMIAVSGTVVLMKYQSWTGAAFGYIYRPRYNAERRRLFFLDLLDRVPYPMKCLSAV